jgi:hypothetical protein
MPINRRVGQLLQGHAVDLSHGMVRHLDDCQDLADVKTMKAGASDRGGE